MGILKSLFGGGTKESSRIIGDDITDISAQINAPSTTKISRDIQNLVLLSIAEKFKVGENKYPDYLRTRFGIGFPKERFNELADAGYIRVASVIESLQNLKVSELKEIAKQNEIKTSGLKDEICKNIIDGVSQENLEKYIEDRFWVITETGHKTLENNPYIGFYVDKHKYSLDEIGLDLNALSKLFTENNICSVRDAVWGALNSKSAEMYIKANQSGEFKGYCELLRTMALFLEEENRFEDGLAIYIRYLHYRTDFDAALKAI